jgi:tetratricopeptide (TPR) repeat protein
MSHPDPPPTPLDAAVAEFHLAEERGEAPDRAAWLARYPECREALGGYFADLDAVADRLAGPAGDGPPGYHLVRVLGRGGAGRVWEAVEVRTGRAVALKLLADPAPEQVRRFRLEAELVSQLEHPNIVPLYEAGEYDGRPYYTMRLVDGGTLADRLGDLRDDPRRAAGLLAAVARAVHFAHQRGVLHRDLKPSNILLDTAAGPAVPLVADFGLARPAAGGVTTRPGIIGTPGYLSPEAANQRPLTTAADVWGLGATLYAALTGRPPFAAESPLAVLRLVCDADPAPPSAANPRVPADLERVCQKCLEKSPDRRYRSAADLADDLDNWLAGRPVTARPLGPAAAAGRWVRRHPMPTALVAAVALGLVAVAGTALAYGGRLADRNRDLTAALDAARRAGDAARAAEAAAQAARAEAEAQAARARDLKTHAERTLADAVRAIDEFADLPAAAEFLRPAARPARALLQRAVLKHDEQVIRDRTEDPAHLETLMTAHNRVGRAYLDAGDHDKALAHFEAAVRLARAVAGPDPPDAARCLLLARRLFRLADARFSAGREADSVPPALEARALLRKAGAADSGSAEELKQLAATDLMLSKAYRLQSRAGDAAPYAAEGLDLARRVADRSPPAGWDRMTLGDALQESAEVAWVRSDFGRARDGVVEAVGVYTSVRPDSPLRADAHLRTLSVSYFLLGQVHAQVGAYPEAAAALREALTRHLALADGDPGEVHALRLLPLVRLRLADALRAGGDQAGWRREMAALPADLDRVPARFWQPAVHGSVRFRVAVAAGQERYDAGQFCEAAFQFRAALDEAPPEHRLKVRMLLATCQVGLGDHAAAAGLLDRLGDAPRADTCYLAACALGHAVTASRADPGLTPDERAAVAEGYARDAVGAMRSAVRAGFRNRQLALTSPALAPLRDRADFRAVLEGMGPPP